MMTATKDRRWRGRATALTLLLTGCGGVGPPGAAADTVAPTPPLSLVVVASRSGHIEQLERVIQDRATPAETLVVTLPATAPSRPSTWSGGATA
jgi:hypothetical protein